MPIAIDINDDGTIDEWDIKVANRMVPRSTLKEYQTHHTAQQQKRLQNRIQFGKTLVAQEFVLQSKVSPADIYGKPISAEKLIEKVANGDSTFVDALRKQEQKAFHRGSSSVYQVLSPRAHHIGAHTTQFASLKDRQNALRKKRVQLPVRYLTTRTSFEPPF